MSPVSISGMVFAFLRVLGSALVKTKPSDPNDGVPLIAGESLTDGETVTDGEMFGALGIVSRPRPAEKIGGSEYHTEAPALRTPRGLIPVAYRDLRLHRRFPNPQPGTVALVGYGGGFLSFDDTANKASSKATLYVPYGRSNVEGAPQKAMVIAIDPEQESIAVVHGEGLAVTIDKDNGIVLRADESTWLAIKPGKIELVAASITARGSVALGRDTTTAIPLLAGPASQPTPSVFFSPT